MAGFSAILTAAGESSRMGRPKALLEWKGLTLVEYQVRSLIDAGVSEVVVVLGHRADEIAPYVEATEALSLVNAEYRLGKATSIKAGLREISGDAEGILVLAVDQPRTLAIISAVLEAHRTGNALITAPLQRGRRGHPVVFSASLRREMEGISEDRQGLREVVQAHRGEVNEVEIDDPMVRLDINTPEEYQEARRVFGG